MSETGVEGSEAVGADFDVIVVGAGFAGVRSLIELEKLGLSARLLEAGSDVGGTWYWNRYPGARTDSLSWTYCFLSDRGLVDEWDWDHNYPTRESVYSYLKWVVDRHGLAPQIQLGTRVKSAVFDAATDRWTVVTEGGEEFTCTYFITCVGHLSAPTVPDWVDADVFEGDVLYTALWPKEEKDLAGKKVALVGTGASGVQVGPKIAAQAEQLTVFQRTPNYVLPARYRDLTDEDRARIRSEHDEIWGRTRIQPWGFDMNLAGRVHDDVADEREREAILEENYEKGGFFYLFEAFDDMVTDQRSNDAASEFLRKKIRETVSDPVTAELLCPTYPLGTKRPPVGERYFDMFNRPNVSLIDVKSDPIASMTARGLKTVSGKEFEADVIVVATGFDVSTGSLTRMDIQGTGELPLAAQWSTGVNTLLGVGVPGFPNMFVVGGPQAAGGNQPVIVEQIIEFVGELIQYARENGKARAEVTDEVASGWTAHVEEVLSMTVVREAASETGSWLVGANTAGKVHQSMFYLGGFNSYCTLMQEIAAGGFKEFGLTETGDPGALASVDVDAGVVVT